MLSMMKYHMTDDDAVSVGGTGIVSAVAPWNVHPSYDPSDGIAVPMRGAAGAAGAPDARLYALPSSPAIPSMIVFSGTVLKYPASPTTVDVQYTPWYVKASANIPKSSRK
jgi:hypothetical protein